MTYIEQEVFNEVKEFVGDNPDVILPLTRYVMEMAVKSGMKVDPIAPDNWDIGWVTGFVMAILAVDLQQNEEISIIVPSTNDDRWGF